ncbi:hypothetical protein AB0M23_04145 [Streptomyces sp. NPDC052077]|uniref:hypothetical protein n=1 Tax=Streptomyces sp. NPDC052077 TaxID=3154757 RepID=UPI0034199007
MTPPSSGRGRSLTVWRWVGGCVGALLLAALAAFVAVSLWIVWVVNAVDDRLRVPDEELLGKMTASSRSRLEKGLIDGTLSEAEIADAMRDASSWRDELDGLPPSVVARYRVGGTDHCYAFVLPVGLRAGGTVESRPLPDCPV